MSNRLAMENSPYLRQHADNPVDWYPWGEEAFERSRAEDKPVFLSVGYAACHWCHVMAHESFEDERVAEYMNDHFINIKVDREERPDVDAIYMDAVVALTGQGGWPMSVFLTPQGAPFYGGTYFPPTRRYKMPSFYELLEEIHRLWVSDRERLLKIGSQLISHLQQAPAAVDSHEILQPELLKQASRVLFDRYDWHHGGWGGAPKFPQPAAIDFLLRIHLRDKDALALDLARHALKAMANGGLYDQIGGGFHRYAVDAEWRVPHFEKMLYDNAGLIRAYLHAWQLTRDVRFLEIVEGTYDFLQAEMRDPAGGYFASLDADSDGEEGRFYTWTLNEIGDVLEDERLTALAKQAFAVSESGNFEGKNVLSFPIELEKLASDHHLDLEQTRDRIALIQNRLDEARSARVRPATDDKVVAAWNGLLLIALAEISLATGWDQILASAQALAGFLMDHMVVDGQLMRSWRKGRASVPAFLEDYAAVGLGLLTLYQVDFNPRWLDVASKLAGTILDRFTDPKGGFYDTAEEQSDLIVRPKSIQDSPYPSGNSLAVMLFLQLNAIDGDTRFYEAALKSLRSVAQQASGYPTAFAGWLSAIDFNLGPQIQLGLAGDPASDSFRRLLGIAAQEFYPRMVRAGGLPTAPNLPALLEDRPMQDRRATAYLCQGFQCQLPTNEPAVLARQIAEALTNDPG